MKIIWLGYGFISLHDVGFVMKGFSHLKPISHEHVIRGFKPLRPILWINVKEYWKIFQKENLAKNRVNLTLRGIPSQRKGGTHYVLTWGGNYNAI